MRIHSNPDIDWSQKSFAALQSIASNLSTQDSLYRFSQRGTYGNRCLDQGTREYAFRVLGKSTNQLFHAHTFTSRSQEQPASSYNMHLT